jgi:hypothetical protein
MIILVPLGVLAGLVAGFAIGKMHERYEWNLKIRQGLIPPPKKKKDDWYAVR